MSLREKQSIFLRNVSRLILWAFNNGYELTGGELLRTKEQQQIYYDSGRSKTMNSKHLAKTAIDLNLFIDGVWQSKTEPYTPLGEYWVGLHEKNRWGGDWDKDGETDDESFKDPYHFEMR